MGTVVSEATVMIKVKPTSARPVACSKHRVSQSRRSNPYSLQTVGLRSTFYTHVTPPPVLTSSLPVPGQAVVCSALRFLGLRLTL